VRNVAVLGGRAVQSKCSQGLSGYAKLHVAAQQRNHYLQWCCAADCPLAATVLVPDVLLAVSMAPMRCLVIQFGMPLTRCVMDAVLHQLFCGMRGMPCRMSSAHSVAPPFLGTYPAGALQHPCPLPRGTWPYPSMTDLRCGTMIQTRDAEQYHDGIVPHDKWSVVMIPCYTLMHERICSIR
jgi:hypothetical protein